MNEHVRYRRFCCPTCGGDLGEAPTVEAIMPSITRRLRPLLKIIAEAGVSGISMDDLVADFSPSKERTFGTSSRLKVYIHELRKEVESFGYYIPRNPGGGGIKGRYKLLPLEAGQ